MEGVDYATLGSAFDRINSENSCLRREVSSLNCALSELFSLVGRLREDLDGITADHDRLAEQVGWQHVGMVRLGGFNPYQSLSIQQRQQVFARERRNMMAYRAMGPDGFMSTVLHQDRLLGLQSDFNVVGGVGARLDYPREEATADTRLLIEFNDVGDGSSLPRDALWAIARNKLQIELYNCLVREDFTRARLFQQALLFFIDVSHQDRLLNRQDQVRLFTYLGDHLESLSDGLRGEDEARANDYLALAIRFRSVASTHWTLEGSKDAVKAHCDPVGQRYMENTFRAGQAGWLKRMSQPIGSEPVRLQSERLEESSIVMKQNYFEFSVSVSNDVNFDRVGRELKSG